LIVRPPLLPPQYPLAFPPLIFLEFISCSLAEATFHVPLVCLKIFYSLGGPRKELCPRRLLISCTVRPSTKPFLARLPPVSLCHARFPFCRHSPTLFLIPSLFVLLPLYRPEGAVCLLFPLFLPSLRMRYQVPNLFLPFSSPGARRFR